jgi:putative hemolysin
MTLNLAVASLALCIFFEAFFSGAEIALIAADKVRLRHRGESGGRGGRAILRYLEEPSELISTALTGTSICVVLSSVVATLVFLPRFPGEAELLSLAVITPLVLIFGEIIPKSIFQTYADRLAPSAIVLLWVFRVVFYPVVEVGSWLSTVFLRILGLDRESKALMSREELGLLLRLPDTGAGVDRITADERQMVSRIFALKDTTVVDVMLPLSEVTALPADATLEEVAQEIAEKQHTRIPLYRERVDQIIGVVHAFDVLRAKGGEKVCDLCRPAIFVPESAQAFETLVRLQREGQGIAVVVDEYGGCIGVVAIEDILEEVVGEIDDEYDEAERDLIAREAAGTYRVLGRTPVERLNAALKLNLPVGEDYETLAGLILDQTKRIPAVGETVNLEGASLTIVKATERSIEQVRVQVTGRRKA